MSEHFSPVFGAAAQAAERGFKLSAVVVGAATAVNGFIAMVVAVCIGTAGLVLAQGADAAEVARELEFMVGSEVAEPLLTMLFLIATGLGGWAAAFMARHAPVSHAVVSAVVAATIFWWMTGWERPVGADALSYALLVPAAVLGALAFHRDNTKSRLEV